MDKKQPVAKYNPKIEKRPSHLDVYSDEKKIFWSFSLFDSDIKFPKSGKPSRTFCEIAKAIKACEQRTWADIDSNRGRDHSIETEKIEKFARERLVEINLDDFDILWSLHFGGLGRLWGIRTKSLMQLLWLDEQHEICPSHMKHT